MQDIMTVKSLRNLPMLRISKPSLAINIRDYGKNYDMSFCFALSYYKKQFNCLPLREKCPYQEFSGPYSGPRSD